MIKRETEQEEITSKTGFKSVFLSPHINHHFMLNTGLNIVYLRYLYLIVAQRQIFFLNVVLFAYENLAHSSDTNLVLTYQGPEKISKDIETPLIDRNRFVFFSGI